MRRALQASVVGLVAFSCLPTVEGGGDGLPEGDSLYLGVLAGGGPESSGTVTAIYLDPANEGAAPAGAPRASEPTLAAKVTLGVQTAEMRGTVSKGKATLTGGGYTMNVAVGKDGSISGTYKTPDGSEGNVALVNNSDGTAQTLCGTYTGSDSGTWNFVINGDGELAGSFYGFADGIIGGSATDTSVSVSWKGEAFGPLSGTASGALTNGGSTVSGTWESSDGSYSGTFMSDGTACAAQPEPVISTAMAAEEACPCTSGTPPEGGACCEGAPKGKLCCVPFQ